MSTRLDSLVNAHHAELDWSPERAQRVRTGALAKHGARVRRERLAQRALLVAAGAGLLLLALLRGAATPPPPAPGESLASRALADAGYTRD